MSLVAFRAQNHPQQASINGAKDDVDDRATPMDLFTHLDRRHAFTLDVAASPHNTKCPRFFGRDIDGLSQSWAGESVWCNPPYSDIKPWVQKAWAEHRTTTGIVMLLPANRTEQRWWQVLVEPYRDRDAGSLRTSFLPGRIRFLKPGRTQVGPNERPPFGCVLLTWVPTGSGREAVS